MGGIKSFLLKSFGFLLLAFSYLAFSGLIMIFFLDEQIAVLQPLLVSSLTPTMEKYLEQQEPQLGDDAFTQVQAFCAMGLSTTDIPEQQIPLPPDLCEKVNSGAVTDMAQLNHYTSSSMVTEVIANLFTDMKPQIQAIKNFNSILISIFAFTFVSSALLLFFDSFNIFEFLHTLSLHSLILAVFTLISLGFFWLMVPSFANSLTSQIMENNAVTEELASALTNLVPALVEWLRGYILKPIFAFLAIAVLSVLVWMAKVGLKNKV